MGNDPIVDEIHAIREEIARRYEYDIDAIVEAMQKASEEHGRHVVSLPPKPVKARPTPRKAG